MLLKSTINLLRFFVVGKRGMREFFFDLETVRKLLKPKRLQLLRVIRCRKSATLDTLAKRVRRKKKAVEADVLFLQELGLIYIQRHKGLLLIKPTYYYNSFTIDVQLVFSKRHLR